jgi:ankyrin repeat protein
MKGINFISDEDGTPLSVASMHGQTKIINYLLDNGADFNHSRGINALEYAVIFNQIDVIDLLIKRGVYVDTDLNEYNSELKNTFEAIDLGYIN